MKVVTFGEVMLRLQPERYLRFMQEPRFEATFGGGEANVAVSVANYGTEAEFVTKLPANDIAEACISKLKSFNVDTKNIVRGGNRVGLYYIEKGASLRPTKIIYDRQGSSIAEASVKDFDFDKIFKGADWLHLSGITPALSSSCLELSINAVKTAKKMGLMVSFDLNYRSSLWDEKDYQSAIKKILPYVDVCIGSIDELETACGIKGIPVDELASKVIKMYGCKYVSTILVEYCYSHDNHWQGVLYTEDYIYYSKKYDIRMIDRIGAGDSYSAGLVYALVNGFEPQQAVDFATAAGALKHTIEGDMNLVSKEEVFALINK